MESLCGLHGFELSMPQGSFPYAKNRSVGRSDLRASEDEFFGHLPRLPSDCIRQHKLRLNVDKYAFRVGAGKFLGYLITNCGIEVNPDQIGTVQRLKPPSNPQEVQILTRMLAALNRFISKYVDRCHPFYQLLKKWKGFQWNEECEKAFQDLK